MGAQPILSQMRFVLLTVTITLCLLAPKATLAQMTPTLIPAEPISPECDFQSGEVTAKCVPIYIAYLIKTIFGFAGAICLFVIMFAGYEFVLGSLTGGDTSAGKERLKWGIIGFIVSALSFFIIDFVISTLAGG